MAGFKKSLEKFIEKNPLHKNNHVSIRKSLTRRSLGSGNCSERNLTVYSPHPCSLVDVHF